MDFLVFPDNFFLPLYFFQLLFLSFSFSFVFQQRREWERERKLETETDRGRWKESAKDIRGSELVGGAHCVWNKNNGMNGKASKACIYRQMPVASHHINSGCVHDGWWKSIENKNSLSMYNKCALFPRSVFHRIRIVSLFVLCLFSTFCEFHRSSWPESWPGLSSEFDGMEFRFSALFSAIDTTLTATVNVIDVVLRLCSTAI